MIIETRAFARAGLIGNPSDGFFGKTIAVNVRNFSARVTLFESPELVIEPHRNDRTAFSGLEDLVEDVKMTGYYGGLRLIKAAAVCFWRYCREHGIEIPETNFTIRYDSDVPVRVGLAGSSAIITATVRALMKFYGVDIPVEVLPNLVLTAETRELGIPAGLQDRVVQTYEGLVYMDFSREHMEEYGRGVYEQLDPALLPPLFVAYSRRLSEGTEVLHSDLRERFESGDRRVHRAMRGFAELTDGFRAALLEGDSEQMHRIINQNFDLRASICQISKHNWQLVNTARNVGVSAKFSGSGGAIVGICEDDDAFCALATEMAEIGAEVVRPEVLVPEPELPEEEAREQDTECEAGEPASLKERS